MTDIIKKSAKEINKLFLDKEISAKEILDQFYKQIEKTESKISALNFNTKDLAYKQAEALDKKNSKGEKLGSLAGVPIVVKDILCVQNYPVTCSSKILENYIAPYESTCTQKLWEAGAMCLAKSNMDEFAMGSSTENSAFKKTKNPWNLNNVPGGSSGGSAAAVSAFQAPISLGTDTGGAIRQPLGFCGIFVL